MKRTIAVSFLLLLGTGLHAQQDSISISATFSEDGKQLSVAQSIVYHNRTNAPLSRIKLLNWAAAYRNRETPLLERMLEDRKNDLYFAKANELAATKDLKIKTADTFENHSAAHENIYISLQQPLMPGKTRTLNLEYNIALPDARFTSYGVGKNATVLKYFFIVPDSFETEHQKPRYYRDMEESQSPGNYWQIQLQNTGERMLRSNLRNVSQNTFEGTLATDPELTISDAQGETLNATIDGQQIEVQFAYELPETQRQMLEFFMPLQLHFIKNKIGALPDKLLITDRFRRDENFIGIDDIKFWKFHYKLFSDAEQTDLSYFSILAKAVLANSGIFEKDEDHWLLNGLKTSLEIQYLHRYYPDRKLLGDLPENLKVLKMRPLKWFHASDIKLTERYGLAYQYMLTQNLDQRIDEKFHRLSNFNATAISHFETGSLFDFVAEKMGHERFDDYVTSFLLRSRGRRVDKKEFLDGLSIASGYSADFLEPFIQHKNRVNFRLKRYTKSEDSFKVKVSKNTKLTIPFKIETQQKNGERESFWFDTDATTKPVEYQIPQANAEKIIINDDYIFPEKNFRDNYRYTQGLFANAKRMKFKLFQDIPNPEYNEVYVAPRLNFNAYDKVLFGINFKNSSLFQRNFEYSFTPYFSSGTGKLTGSGGVAYSFQPAESFYRSLDVGVSASHFHYDYDLTYRKISTFANLNFAKNPRSDIRRNVSFSYNFLEKDLDPNRKDDTEYAKYNLWNLGYGYANRQLIHEKYFNTGLQWMEDFQKISTEFSYRYEFAEDKKVSVRFFGGYFLSNTAKNDLFNYGISRVSNYAFSYGLLGQSATSGVLAQQMVLAEGGFKSLIGTTANQWITTANVDAHVWRWFNVYADAGVYKNKHVQPEFIWDSGIKLKVIPDFLEVYFPMQSSLGFEPSFSDYAKRIRFTLNLNLSALTSYFRRGWF